MIEIARKIKKARNEKGLSQQELADQLFITKQSISKYENSHALPSKEIMKNLESILDVKLDNTPKSWITNKKQKVTVIVVFSLLFVISVYLAVSMFILSNRYESLQKEYNQVTQSNVLDYSGVSIIYDGIYAVSIYDNTIDLDMTINNPSTFPFQYDSSLVSFHLKFVDEEQIIVRSPSRNQAFIVGSSSTASWDLTFVLEFSQDQEIEWFEIYYGDMFVAKETVN